MLNLAPESAARAAILLLPVLLSACGGGSSDQATSSTASVEATTPGTTPFIDMVKLAGTGLSSISAIRYIVSPKPGATAQPVTVTYTISALARRGYEVTSDGALTVPIFGLYSGYANTLTLQLGFRDGSVKTLPLTIESASYSDPTGIYAQPTILVKRDASSALGFNYFAIKSGDGTPVVIDTDGEIRWVGTGLSNSGASVFKNAGFIVGEPNSVNVSRLELDGTLSTGTVDDATFVNFHHNIDPGKVGSLAEFTTNVAGISNVATTAAEITASGHVLAKWDFAALISAYMSAHGDDPTQFVRSGVDWFHMNATAYDRRDNSLIASSRENFVIKVDYDTGEIIWILGDPTKYWYTFPSLRAKAITVQDGGLYPIGQHGISITRDGLLLLFNDGLGSLNQPIGAPAGASRNYSVVSGYSIDSARLTAREAWSFDYGHTIYSDICSSAYQSADGSTLITYATADNRTTARLVGLDMNKRVAFDFKYPSPVSCGTAWNSIPIPFESLYIDR